VLVSYHNPAQPHNPEDLDFNLHCHENLKSHKMRTSRLSDNMFYH
jgi:hypothetical protein